MSDSNFNAIRISLASPEQIRSWSYGEVTKPETLNYRTLKPEKDGLFCERIFGPTKDFECYCGKYKKVRYKGVICDRCGVEVARSKVRRERMAHIELAAPVSHIWYVKGTPSRLGLLLDLSPRSLERVLYFAQYIITRVDEETRGKAIEAVREELARQVNQAEEGVEKEIEGIEAGKTKQANEKALAEENKLRRDLEQKKTEMVEELRARIEELEDLKPRMLISESKYKEIWERYGSIVEAGMGAEAILEILSQVDLEELRESLQQEIRSTSGQRRKKATKRLRVVEALRKSGNRQEWMILTVLPVLPPDLRPMVQLDGGRFATSDLNDLYRRVINRNNRLKRLLELGAPEIIVRNEKRMLQEAVDALIDNGRRGRAIAGSHNHKLKSLSDMLRGKQGRFRQNLLGKRVDYSGRSVIVVGPELKLHQCGLPKRMALELFKPFVMHKLVSRGHAHNIKSAKRMVERGKPEAWDVLEEVIKVRPVLLNRAPTLHRLGIQAFEPVLIDGSAIQIHPLVCTAFNADFDGDQMAVHVPLSKAAVLEARKIMLSTNNLLSPSSSEPIVAPTLDMVMGCYYMTSSKKGAKGEGKTFSNFDEAKLAYELGVMDIQAEIEVRNTHGERIKTTVGRILFNEILPKEIEFQNTPVDKKALRDIVAECYRILGNEATADVLDDIKNLGFRFATKSGTTIALNDLQVPIRKAMIMDEASQMIAELEKQYQRGLINDQERYNKAVQIWTEASDKMTEVISEELPSYGGIYMMAASGAKGNIAQIKQMVGMRGLMTDPRGKIIDLPIKSSFQEGLSVLEYFISTHGARKGLADTALRTADSGYLTRRLIDVSQEVIVLEENCGTVMGVWFSSSHDRAILGTLAERIVGRTTASRVVNPTNGEVIVEANQEVDEEKARKIESLGINRVYVRSPLTCESKRGICRLCYGRSLATGKLVAIGEAGGVIAAQSIGEPGTQLTMRTFHTGGVAGVDITSGLPRVEELFEARAPKGQAVLSEIDGLVEITEEEDGRKIKVVSSEIYRDEYKLPQGYVLEVNSESWVEAGTVLAHPPKEGKAKAKDKDIVPASPVIARNSGRVVLEGDQFVINYEEREEREYLVQAAAHILVENGAQVKAGDQLTEGPISPQDILRIRGREAVQQYLIEEVQKVYRSQGVTINDKHIEVIIRQMLRKVRVDSPGDTDLLPGELVDRVLYEEINAKVLAEGGEPATAQAVLLGVTKASLNTDSFLAAASFQETTRVLTEAALQGSIDRLRGLKENVIIGRLIPASFEMPELVEKATTSEEPLAELPPVRDEEAEKARALFDSSGEEKEEL
ncbi:MAG: DNA-directed RNA polymerase subunit beta' [Chloroflexi bacterium]|nr:DNA-directed RNA polymerase subunit beta' [Chloroflexota bacterium]